MTRNLETYNLGADGIYYSSMILIGSTSKTQVVED